MRKLVPMDNDSTVEWIEFVLSCADAQVIGLLDVLYPMLKGIKN